MLLIRILLLVHWSHAFEQCYITATESETNSGGHLLWHKYSIPRTSSCAVSCFLDYVCYSFQYSPSLKKCSGYSYGTSSSSSSQISTGLVNFAISSCKSVCDRSEGYVYDIHLSPPICFKYRLRQGSWEEAKTDCEISNARLLVLDSDNKLQHFLNYIRLIGAEDIKAWLGLRGNMTGNGKMVLTWLNKSPQKQVGRSSLVEKGPVCGQITPDGIKIKTCSWWGQFICEKLLK